MVGYDQDPEAIKIAFENIERAGMRGFIHVEKRELAVFAPKAKETSGLVVVNPPYGERLGEEQALQSLYTCLGDRLKLGFAGWRAAVFTGNPDLGKQMGIRAKKNYALFNGALPCKLLLFDVVPEYFIDRSPAADNERRIRAAQRALAGQDVQGVEMFVNRLRKNLRNQAKLAKQTKQTSYRVYDADIPEYAFAIDISEEEAHVHEYQAPRTVDPRVALRRQQEVLSVLPELLALAPKQIYFDVQPAKIKIGK